MTTPATASSLREALTPEALTRARRRLLTAHPDPTRANTPTPGSLTDEQLRVLAASDWAPPRIAALDTNTLTTADPITRALLAESVRETLKRRLAADRPYGTYDDTRAGHDAFSTGLVDDYDHGNHHLARATIHVADPGLVTCAALSELDAPEADAPGSLPATFVPKTASLASSCPETSACPRALARGRCAAASTSCACRGAARTKAPSSAPTGERTPLGFSRKWPSPAQ